MPLPNFGEGLGIFEKFVNITVSLKGVELEVSSVIFLLFKYSSNFLWIATLLAVEQIATTCISCYLPPLPVCGPGTGLVMVKCDEVVWSGISNKLDTLDTTEPQFASHVQADGIVTVPQNGSYLQTTCLICAIEISFLSDAGLALFHKDEYLESAGKGLGLKRQPLCSYYAAWPAVFIQPCTLL
eukprot:g31313.t1